MSIHKINRHLMSVSKPYMVICPHCDNDELTVMMVTREKKYTLVQLRCYSEECKGEPVYDVNGGVITRLDDDE